MIIFVRVVKHGLGQNVGVKHNEMQ